MTLGLCWHFLDRSTKDVRLLNCINASEDDLSKYIPLELLDGRYGYKTRSVQCSRHICFSNEFFCSSLGKRDSSSVIDKTNSGGDDLSKLQRKRRKDLDLIKLEEQESAGAKKNKKDEDESDGEVSA